MNRKSNRTGPVSHQKSAPEDPCTHSRRSDPRNWATIGTNDSSGDLRAQPCPGAVVATHGRFTSLCADQVSHRLLKAMMRIVPPQCYLPMQKLEKITPNKSSELN